MIKRIVLLLVVVSAVAACGKKVPVRPPDTLAETMTSVNL